MDYYDDNPLKVNKRNNLLTNLKQTRKEERKARKALKAQRMAELLVEQEKQRELDEKFAEIDEKEKLKKCESFKVRDQFNWDELEEELHNDDASDGDDTAWMPTLPPIRWRFHIYVVVPGHVQVTLNRIKTYNFCVNKDWSEIYSPEKKVLHFILSRKSLRVRRALSDPRLSIISHRAGIQENHH